MFRYIVMLIFISCAQSQPKMEAPVGDKPGTISYSPPDLNDEEAHSSHMPTSLKCDACKAIAYQYAKGFEKAEAKLRNKKGDTLESELIEVIEKVCESKVIEDYGLKEIDGVKQLAGEGLPGKDAPGIMQGGGKWPGRLREMCVTYPGELGELEIYSNYLTNPKKKSLQKYLCYGPGPVRNYCNKQKEDKKKRMGKPKTEL